MSEKEGGEYVALARIARPQGRRGEVVAELLTESSERFTKLKKVFVGEPGGESRPLGLERAWAHKGRVVLKFSGVDSMDAAEELRGLHVMVPAVARAPLEPGRYYVSDLVGCRVFAEREGARREIGTVTEIEPTGGADVLHVAPSDGRRNEILIPLAEEICTEIDPAAKTIVVSPPEDLLELNE
jgi:16S rRNA processing protein RimM